MDIGGPAAFLAPSHAFHARQHSRDSQHYYSLRAWARRNGVSLS
jgi:hypothetical protein